MSEICSIGIQYTLSHKYNPVIYNLYLFGDEFFVFRRRRADRDKPPSGPGADTHLAENHEDTSTGAVHCFQVGS